MSELEQLKKRIDESGTDGVRNDHIREDYEPIGDMMLHQLTSSGEYVQSRFPLGTFDSHWHIYKKGNEPF